MQQLEQRLANLGMELLQATSIPEVREIQTQMVQVRNTLVRLRGAQRHKNDPTGRLTDLADLERRYMQTSDPAEKARLAETARQIRNESGLIKSMRVELIKATRAGDHQRVREIHDSVERNRKFQNA